MPSNGSVGASWLTNYTSVTVHVVAVAPTRTRIVPAARHSFSTITRSLLHDNTRHFIWPGRHCSAVHTNATMHHALRTTMLTRPSRTTRHQRRACLLPDAELGTHLGRVCCLALCANLQAPYQVAGKVELKLVSLSDACALHLPRRIRSEGKRAQGYALKRCWSAHV